MTALEGPVSCTGMEYPMLTCIGGPRDTLSLYSVQIHETGHMWFPMQVGSDERRYRVAGRRTHALQSGAGHAGVLQGLRPRAARRATRTSRSRTPTARCRSCATATSTRYDTPGLQHRVVREDGDEHGGAARAARRRRVLCRATGRTGCAGSTSIRRHMTSSIRSIRSSGRDLSWFWRTWWYETWTLDQAIASVQTPNGQKLVVTIEDRGLAPMPIRLAITRARRNGRASERFPWTSG